MDKYLSANIISKFNIFQLELIFILKYCKYQSNITFLCICYETFN